MCYYITVAVHEDDQARVQAALPATFRLNARTIPKLRSMLPPGFEMFYVSERDLPCSCGLYNIESDYLESAQNELSQFVKRCRKAGWSESRIRRAAASRQHTVDALSQNNWVGLHPVIVKALKSTHSKRHALYIHIHNTVGELETERMNVLRKHLNVSRLEDPDDPVAEDILWEIV